MNVVHDYQIEKDVLALDISGCPSQPGPISGYDKLGIREKLMVPECLRNYIG